MHVRGTLDEFLSLGADDITIMNTWVDASYAVHKDFKSHTGGAVSFGRGAVMSKSAKQKLNTKSSTEAELVGASDYLPYPIWGKRFLEGQGYYLKENIFHQDNMSSIQFEKNGRKTHWHPVFLDQGSPWPREHGGRLLSHRTDASGFLYETTSRKFVPQAQGRRHGTQTHRHP